MLKFRPKPKPVFGMSIHHHATSKCFLKRRGLVRVPKFCSQFPSKGYGYEQQCRRASFPNDRNQLSRCLGILNIPRRAWPNRVLKLSFRS